MGYGIDPGHAQREFASMLYWALNLKVFSVPLCLVKRAVLAPSAGASPGIGRSNFPGMLERD